MHRLLFLYLNCVALLLVGCAGSPSDAPSTASPPALPAPPSQLPRSASFDPANLRKSGAEFEAGLPHQRGAATGNDTLQLDPTAGGSFAALAYALFRFQVDDFAGTQLTLVFKPTVPSAGSVWIGLAEPEQDRWSWHTPNALGQLTVASFEEYRYPGGEVLLAVVATGSASLELHHIQVGPYDDSALPLETITLPPGFKISLYAYPLPSARGMTFGPNNTLYLGSNDAGSVYATRDYNGDTRADELVELTSGFNEPVGVAYQDGDLYFTAVSEIWKLPGVQTSLDNPPAPELVFGDLPSDASHGWRYLAFGPDGKLYVPVGAPCNICEPAAPYAMIHRLNTDGSGFTTVARGQRNTVGFTWHPTTGEMWWTDNGRDGMGDDVPSDELNRIPAGSETGANAPHFGYPYWHATSVPDPGFGDGHDAGEFELPVQELGPHVAGLGLRFYTGTQFPAEYQHDLFIAEHGSWNRSVPLGARVTRVRVSADGLSSEGYEVFAEGWQGPPPGYTRWGRPADVEIAPDGSLLVSDDRAGAVYRIYYAP
jgi:glucose/arabinose dehydrogenase